MALFKLKFTPLIFVICFFFPLKNWAQTNGPVNFDQIKAAYLSEDFLTVIDYSTQLLKNEPANLDVRLILARSLHLKGKQSLAWDQIKKSLTLEKSPYVYETASDLATWEERYILALKYMKLARVKNNDNDPSLTAKYIRLLKLLGRYSEANKLEQDFEAQHGTKFQSSYNDVLPISLPQELFLEVGLADADEESRLRRHLMLGYFNKNQFVDFGFGLTRDTRFQEVGLNFSADAYMNIPIGEHISYAHISASRSNKKVFADYSLTAEYHIGIGKLGEIGAGYTYSDYEATLGRTWNISALVYLGDFTPSLTYYWGPTDYIKDSDSWLFRLTWMIDEQWKVAPYFSFGREVDEASSGFFNLTNFREWGGRLFYNLNLDWGINTSVWLRKEKLVNGKPVDAEGGTLGLSYYFR